MYVHAYTRMYFAAVRIQIAVPRPEFQGPGPSNQSSNRGLAPSAPRDTMGDTMGPRKRDRSKTPEVGRSLLYQNSHGGFPPRTDRCHGSCYRAATPLASTQVKGCEGGNRRSGTHRKRWENMEKSIEIGL